MTDSYAHDLVQAVRKLLDAGDTNASAVLTADEARAIMAFARPALLQVLDDELESRMSDALWGAAEANDGGAG